MATLEDRLLAKTSMAYAEGHGRYAFIFGN